MAPRLHRIGRPGGNEAKLDPKFGALAAGWVQRMAPSSPSTQLSWHGAVCGRGGAWGKGRPLPLSCRWSRTASSWDGSGTESSPGSLSRESSWAGSAGKAPLLFLHSRGTFTPRAVSTGQPPLPRQDLDVLHVALSPVSHCVVCCGLGRRTPGKLRHAEWQRCPSGFSRRGRNQREVRVSIAFGKPRNICRCRSVGESAGSIECSEVPRRMRRVQRNPPAPGWEITEGSGDTARGGVPPIQPPRGWGASVCCQEGLGS